jgi:hypothetical protein
VNGACSTHRRDELRLQCSQNGKGRDDLRSLGHSWNDDINPLRSSVGLSPPLKIPSSGPMSDSVRHMLYVFYTRSGVSGVYQTFLVILLFSL